jgi:zinc transporter
MTTHDIKFREEILQIRTQSAVFKRYLFPQREVISKLGASNLDWISDWTKRHFQENFDKINHMIEEVGEAINRSQILHDELANALSEKLNRSMYRLSLITVIFMPLTFIAGLFGMNVGGIPGNTEPLAFYICSATMLVIAALQILFFKKRDWF